MNRNHLWSLNRTLDLYRNINALTETINGLYKTEVIRRCGPWRNLEAVEFATLEWVDWFNNRRLLDPIGGIPPAEAEARYYAQLDMPNLRSPPERLTQTKMPPANLAGCGKVGPGA